MIAALHQEIDILPTVIFYFLHCCLNIFLFIKRGIIHHKNRFLRDAGQQFLDCLSIKNIIVNVRSNSVTFNNLLLSKIPTTVFLLFTCQPIFLMHN